MVIGTSAGGLDALARLLPALPRDFPAPVAVVQHLHPAQDGFLASYLNGVSGLRVEEARDKETLWPGVVFLAPADYHLLVESDRTLALSTDEKVHHSRPSIDVLFTSAAEAFGPGVVAVVLSGASRDGASGLAAVRRLGGVAVVEDPATSQYPYMPQSALEAAGADHVLPVEAIGPLLARLAGGDADGAAR